MAIKHLKIIKSNGFTLIEMIAAMVLVAIIVPGMSLIVRGTLINIAFTNIALQANMDADYAQRKFALHLDGISSFTNGTLNDTTLKFTSGFNGSTYEFQIRSATRSISYKRASGALGLLLQNVVVDTTILQATNRVGSRFIKCINNRGWPFQARHQHHGEQYVTIRAIDCKRVHGVRALA